jgi:hypothetical protein
VHITVDTTLERGIVHMDPGLGVLSGVAMSGAAPYFHFDIAVSSIGAPLGKKLDYAVYYDDPNSENAATSATIGARCSSTSAPASDTAMLSTDWYDPHASHDSEEPQNDSTITVTEVSGDRVDLQFGGPIGPVGDNLYACAIVFRNGEGK